MGAGGGGGRREGGGRENRSCDWEVGCSRWGGSRCPLSILLRSTHGQAAHFSLAVWKPRGGYERRSGRREELEGAEVPSFKRPKFESPPSWTHNIGPNMISCGHPRLIYFGPWTSQVNLDWVRGHIPVTPKHSPCSKIRHFESADPLLVTNHGRPPGAASPRRPGPARRAAALH